MLKGLIAWWLAQLVSLLPARWRSRDHSLPDAIVAEPAGDGFALRLRRRRRESALGRFALDEPGLRAAAAAVRGRRGGPAVLRFAPAMLLEREVVLPLAAERELEQVLRYEMDRFTPFGAEEVFWTAEPVARDRATGRLRVRLSLVPRAAVAPMLQALGRIGAAPAALEAALPGGVRAIPLGGDHGRARRQRRVVSAAATVCAGLALVAVALPFVTQSLALDAVDARIAALRPRVTLAEALRRRIAANTNGADVIAAESARLGDALQALAALTEILPDDTYLTNFALRQRHLTIDGQSAAAPRLIGLLSADPTILNPAFAAPVMRTENGRADLFSIHAELSP